MKKAVVFCVILILILINVEIGISQSGISDEIEERFNVSIDNIPTSGEDIETIRQEYLKQEWTKLIEKNKFLGPIHKFLIKISPFFSVVFAQSYEFSLTMFLIIFLWFLIFIQAATLVRSTSSIKEGFALIIGALCAIILAQTKLLKIIVGFVLDLVFKQGNWWIRLLIWILIVGIIAFEWVAFRLATQASKKNKEEKRKKELEQGVKEVKALTEGAKRG